MVVVAMNVVKYALIRPFCEEKILVIGSCMDVRVFGPTFSSQIKSFI